MSAPSGARDSGASERALRLTPLPSELTRFVGRNAELEELRRWVLDERLVTLTGPGGIGKTRIALELARDLSQDLPAAWVELAGISRPELLLSMVSRALGVEEDVPSLTAISERLAGEPVLIVLDSCEHLVDSCADLARDLLALMPNARVLATSREALGVPGERAWLILPLPVPAGSALEETDSDAVELFVDRARDVVPTFGVSFENADAIGEICRRLDGIPLALELAAARVKVLTPRQISQRLDDMFGLLANAQRRSVPRHRTMRAAMEWSHQLLPDPLKIAFRRLSVFRGGFDLDAAEAVVSGEGVPPSEVLNRLALLVDRSFVVVREIDGISRYHILEPVRQYGADALAEAGEAAEISERHARYCLSLVAEAVPHLVTPERRAWVSRLHPDFDNLRAAINWSRADAKELHVELVGSIWWLWFSSRHWVEAREWLERALELPVASNSSIERGRLLFGAGVLDTLQGRPEIARGRLIEANALAKQLGDGRLASYALNYLGIALVMEGSLDAEAPLLEGRQWLEENRDLYGLRLNFLALGNHYAAEGDLDRALDVVGQGVAVARGFGVGRELAIALETLAILHVRRRELAAAEPLLLEALEALMEDWGAVLVVRALEFLGLVRGHVGSLEEAGRLIGAAEVLREFMASPPFPVEGALVTAAVAEFVGSPQAAAFEEGRSQGRSSNAESLVMQLVRGGSATPTSPAPPPLKLLDELEPATLVDTPSYEMRVLALGPLNVFLGNDPIPEGAWPFSKPRELLLFLLLEREGWTREELARALWPDSSAAQLKNSFHVALHHLRKVLGDPSWVIIERDRYRLSPQRRIYFDLKDFEDRAKEVLGSSSDSAPSEAVLRSVLALYRGDFAEDQTSARWADDPADRARALRRQLGIRLGDMLESELRIREAAEVFRELAQTEELHEEIQRRFMLALTCSGERLSALRQYERLRELLSRELDAEPEEETRLLWEQIKAGGPSAAPLS